MVGYPRESISSEGELPLTCAHCGSAAADFACSRCQSVRYCTRACQRAHWGCHKVSCRWSHSTAQRPSEPRPSDSYCQSNVSEWSPRSNASNWLPRPSDVLSLKLPWSAQKLAHEKWEHPELEETIRQLDGLTDRLQATERLHPLEPEDKTGERSMKVAVSKSQEFSLEKAMETQIKMQASPMKGQRNRLGRASTFPIHGRPGFNGTDNEPEDDYDVKRCHSDVICGRTASRSTVPGDSPSIGDRLEGSPTGSVGLLESAARFATSLGCTMRSPRKRAGLKMKDVTLRSGETFRPTPAVASTTQSNSGGERESLGSQVPTPQLACKEPMITTGAPLENSIAFPALLGISGFKPPLLSEVEPLIETQDEAPRGTVLASCLQPCLKEAMRPSDQQLRGNDDQHCALASTVEAQPEPVVFPRPARLVRPDL